MATAENGIDGPGRPAESEAIIETGARARHGRCAAVGRQVVNVANAVRSKASLERPLAYYGRELVECRELRGTARPAPSTRWPAGLTGR
jgi:hypothetical protein